RTHRPVGVEVGAGEQEQRDEDRQRGDVLGLVVGEDEVRLVPDGGLRLERRPDREENADRVERAQHGHARDRAEGVEPDQRAQQAAASTPSERPGAAQPRLRPRPSRAQIEPAALALLARHSAGLLATARRYSLTLEDAEDAYQRGVEILLTKAPTTREEQLLPWLKTVVKHEAFAVRKSSGRAVPADPRDE